MATLNAIAEVCGLKEVGLVPKS